MDVIEIDKARLLFILDPYEVVKYSIYSSTSESTMKEGYERLLSDTGVFEKFNTGVLVEIFDSKDGGCEMFVTKITSTAGIDHVTNDQMTIYIFSHLCNLLEACQMLSKMGFEGGRAYKSYNNDKFYLLLEFEAPYITEFRAKRAKQGATEYLFEHCTLLSDSAIETLSRLA